MYEGPQGGKEGERKIGFSDRATAVSYDRPWHNRLSFPLGQTQNFLFSTEYPLLYWLEKHAFDVTYASCADVENMFPLPNLAQQTQGTKEGEGGGRIDTNTYTDKDKDTDTAYDKALSSVARPYRRFKALLSAGHDEYVFIPIFIRVIRVGLCPSYIYSLSNPSYHNIHNIGTGRPRCGKCSLLRGMWGCISPS